MVWGHPVPIRPFRSRNTVTWETGIFFLDALSTNDTITTLNLARTWGFKDKMPVERASTIAPDPELAISPGQVCML